MHCGDVIIPHIESSETFGGVSHVNNGVPKKYTIPNSVPRGLPHHYVWRLLNWISRCVLSVATDKRAAISKGLSRSAMILRKWSHTTQEKINST